MPNAVMPKKFVAVSPDATGSTTVNRGAGAGAGVGVGAGAGAGEGAGAGAGLGAVGDEAGLPPHASAASATNTTRACRAEAAEAARAGIYFSGVGPVYCRM